MESRKTILLVDDDNAVGRAMKRVLDQNGFKTIFVNTAEDGLLAAQENNCDLCITDLALPGMNGLELIQQVRLIPRIKDLPFIIQTGFAQKMVNELLAQRPLRVFLKPVRTEDLLWTIWDYFGPPKVTTETKT